MLLWHNNGNSHWNTNSVWWRKNHQLCHHESETETFFFFLPNSLIHVSFFVPLHCFCCKCWSLPWVIQTNCSQFRLDKRHRAMKCKKIWVCMKLPLNEIWQGDILYLLRVDSQGRRSWSNLLTELYNVFVVVKGLFGLKLLGWVSHYRPL